MDGIIASLTADRGILGLSVGVLLIAIAALWRRLVKVQDAYFEQSVQTTAALVEFNMLWRTKK
jgi:hypothetical protein